MVLLLENHYTSGEYFQTIRKRCWEYLKENVPAGIMEAERFHIVEPEFVELSVKAGIVVRDMNSIMETRRKSLEFLEQFLDPLLGNFQGNGWEIGQVPNQMQLLNALRRVPGVLQVDSLRVKAVVRKNGQAVEIDPEEVSDMKFAIAVNGMHEIDILTGGGNY